MLTRGRIILFSAMILAAGLTALITWGLSQVRSKSVIREQGPESHKAKASTPSTGGLAFLTAFAVIGFPSAILLLDPKALIGITIGLLSGMLGLADDMLKLARNDTSGLKARFKLPLQIFTGFLAAGAVYYLLQDTSVRIPFLNIEIDLGVWKIVLGIFAYLAIINGVNFTDGLDGLASGTVLIASVFLGAAIWITHTGSALVPMVLTGICIGFLIFNWHPAKIFMGDAGSLALGGALAGTAIATGLEIILFIIGLVFIIEISSVVLQVAYFRLTRGKRLFRMSPIHHAWELRGYREPAIVIGASVIGIIAGALALWSVANIRPGN